MAEFRLMTHLEMVLLKFRPGRGHHFLGEAPHTIFNDKHSLDWIL